MIEVMDAPTGSPKYIPINKVLTGSQYNALIADIFELQQPQMPSDDNPVDPQVFQQESVKFVQQLTQAKAKFEQENDVKKRPTQGWNVNGEGMTEDELAGMIKDSGMPPEEFDAKYRPEEGQITMYAVNMLSERKMDLNVRFEVDTDFDADLDYRMNRALMLRKMGLMSGLDTLKELNMPNAEQVKENADKDNQVLQLAAQIASKPEVIPQIQAMIAQAGIGQGAQ